MERWRSFGRNGTGPRTGRHPRGPWSGPAVKRSIFRSSESSPGSRRVPRWNVPRWTGTGTGGVGEGLRIKGGTGEGHVGGSRSGGGPREWVRGGFRRRGLRPERTSRLRPSPEPHATWRRRPRRDPASRPKATGPLRPCRSAPSPRRTARTPRRALGSGWIVEGRGVGGGAPGVSATGGGTDERTERDGGPDRGRRRLDGEEPAAPGQRRLDVGSAQENVDRETPWGRGNGARPGVERSQRRRYRR